MSRDDHRKKDEYEMDKGSENKEEDEEDVEEKSIPEDMKELKGNQRHEKEGNKELLGRRGTETW